MTRQSKALARAERMSGVILAALKDGTVAQAETMAAAAGVSIRTFYRHVKRMQAYGVKIEGERGVGYMLKKGNGNGC